MTQILARFPQFLLPYRHLHSPLKISPVSVQSVLIHSSFAPDLLCYLQKFPISPLRIYGAFVRLSRPSMGRLTFALANSLRFRLTSRISRDSASFRLVGPLYTSSVNICGPVPAISILLLVAPTFLQPVTPTTPLCSLGTGCESPLLFVQVTCLGPVCVLQHSCRWVFPVLITIPPPSLSRFASLHWDFVGWWRRGS
jgi:hypothetical protein